MTGVFELDSVRVHYGKVEALKGRIESSEALLLTEYRGLSVGDISTLRRSLRDAGGEYLFTNLAAGSYSVEEVLKPGWVQSAAPGAIPH